MKKLLQTAKDVFEGRSFEFREKSYLPVKIYNCTGVVVRDMKLLIECKERTFVFSEENKFHDFVGDVVFLHDDVAVRQNSLPAVPYYPSNLDTVSNSLLDMFNKIASGDASDEEIKKMKTASDIAGKIVDIERVKHSFMQKV